MFSAVSLFCGAGGLDLGFASEGFDLVYACDNDPAAIETYKRNIDSRAHLCDVTSPEFEGNVKAIGGVDVVLGGFPCQGFSKSGPKKSDDVRNKLYLEMRKAVMHLQPKVFIAENVDGLSQNFGGHYLRQIYTGFEELGYSVEYRILNAARYGVPQHRRRVFFVGVRDALRHPFNWPEPTHTVVTRNGESEVFDSLPLSPKVLSDKPPVTIRDAISDLRLLDANVADHRVVLKWPKRYDQIIRKIGPCQKLCNVRFAPTSVFTWDIPEVFGKVTKPQIEVLETIGKNRRHKKYGSIPNGNPLAQDIIEGLSGLPDLTKDLARLVEKGYLKEQDGKYDLKGAMFCSGLFKRPDWEQPSPTILTNFYNPRYFLHPTEDRPFSLRECARLQGFPDSFMFTDSESEQKLKDGYRLVGNAVPPALAKLFGRSVTKLLDRMNGLASW